MIITFYVLVTVTSTMFDYLKGKLVEEYKTYSETVINSMYSS